MKTIKLLVMLLTVLQISCNSKTNDEIESDEIPPATARILSRDLIKHNLLYKIARNYNPRYRANPFAWFNKTQSSLQNYS